jgi:hypothetical protein
VKYIVVGLDGKEQIFVFPKTVDHDRMYEAMEVIRFGDSHNWERKLYDGKAISAGFITDGKCHGRSETLDLASRGDVDTKLFREHLA